MKGSDWIAGAAALGTWAAVTVALFGDKIRATLLKRTLRLELADPRGELIDQVRSWTDESGRAQQRVAKARYYHVIARNLSRAPAAHELQVMLTRVETEGPSGAPQPVWTGALPLIWTHMQLHPVARTVGPDASADIFHVLDGKLELSPMLVPNNFQHQYRGPARLWLTLQARAIEGDSKPLRVQIAWNGKWELGEAEMAKHLIVTATEQASP